MCGIFFSAIFHSGESDEYRELTKQLKAFNSQRGPDAQNTIQVNLLDVETSLEFFASELRLRGDTEIVQPHHADAYESDILCWNGEIFGGLDISAHENDGVKLFEALQQCKNSEDICNLFGKIEGPYAFVFYRHASRQVFFGRDPLGRRSLLIHKPTVSAPYLLLASTAARSTPQHSFEELPTGLLYCFNTSASCVNIDDMSARIVELVRNMRRSPYASPDRINTNTPPNDLPLTTSLDAVPEHIATVVDGFLSTLETSVKLRVQDIPIAADCRESDARVGVLFSGGIDCTVVALLANNYIPMDEPIDLLNVAFENPWKQSRASGKQKNEIYLVPDRVTGLEEVEELRRLCPSRQWNFIEIDVPYSESQGAIGTITDLMHPANTVMDLSLSSALYFASRGSGQIKSNGVTQPYTSPARVLLSGLGSDELLGGYARHLSCFKLGGWDAVVNELQLEIDRIPVRNLGRDDRIISSHGKETRHPYLSLDFVNYVTRLPVHSKLDPRASQGMGDKLLLRAAARKLGLIEASGRKKRAMQFGSRSARMQGEKEGAAAIPN